MKYTIFVLIYIQITLSSLAQPIQKLRVDPAYSYGGMASEYFENIEYIPLETKKESLFGTADQLFITDSSFIINDNNDTKSVLFFDLKGKFIYRFKSKLEDVSISVRMMPDNKTICIIEKDWIKDIYIEKIFTHKGVFLNESKHTSFGSVVVPLGDNRSAHFNTISYIDRRSQQKKGKAYIDIYKGQEKINHYFPIENERDEAFVKLASRITVPQGDALTDLFFAMPLTHQLYKLNKDTLVQTGQFIFPSDRLLNLGNLTSKTNTDSLERELRKDQKMIYEVQNIFYFNSKILFRIKSLIYHIVAGSESTYQYNFIYDTLKHKLVSLERIVPDITTSYLPLFGNNTTLSGLKKQKDNLFSVVSSLELFNADKKNKNRNPQYPPVLQQYFKTQNRKSNPVIVRMKLKE